MGIYYKKHLQIRRDKKHFFQKRLFEKKNRILTERFC